jgi:hypothetical protein
MVEALRDWVRQSRAADQQGVPVKARKFLTFTPILGVVWPLKSTNLRGLLCMLGSLFTRLVRS